MTIKLYKLDENSEKINLLKIIKKYGTVTRGQIANFTGYSSAKISLLIKELEEKNLVADVGEDASTGGRKAKLLKLRGEKAYFVGVELGSYELKISLIDFSGDVIASKKTLEDPGIIEPDEVMSKLVVFIKRFLNEHKRYTSGIKWLGLALSGIIDDETGVCRYFRNQKSWEGVPVKDIIEKELNMRCVIDDSSRMMAVAERIYGSCRHADNFVLFSIGVGLGTGIYINGELFRGSRGLAGELGHMVIKENGPRCVCGNHGCLESLCSGYAIQRCLKEALRDNVYSSLASNEEADARDIVEQAKAGDKLAYSIISSAASHLGTGIANTINIFNPEIVVLAGGVSKAGEMLLEPIQQVVRASALETSARDTTIIISSLDEYAASLGIANRCIDRMLDGSEASRIII